MSILIYSVVSIVGLQRYIRVFNDVIIGLKKINYTMLASLLISII